MCVCVEGYISNMVSRIDFLLHICFLVSNSRVTHLFTMVFVGVTVLWLQINVVIVLKNLISHVLTKITIVFSRSTPVSTTKQNKATNQIKKNNIKPRATHTIKELTTTGYNCCKNDYKIHRYTVF